MSNQEMRDALVRISELTRFALRHDHEGHDDWGGDDAPGGEARVCTPVSLPRDLLVEAAQTAIAENPANAPAFGPLALVDLAPITDPLQIAVLTAKYWGPQSRELSVSFMDTPDAALRKRILQHMNAWSVGIRFRETRSDGQVRISRSQPGYWSYVGTDILHIERAKPTMNLQGFTMNTPDSEFVRVVRHETGHTLGAPHEHMRKELVARIDPEKAYEYFWRTQRWDRAMVDAQVLTSLDDRSLLRTPPDQTSIMCYQLPASITRDGKPILGGKDINATDRAFMLRLYPAASRARRFEEHDYGGEEHYHDSNEAVYTFAGGNGDGDNG
ncbi:MAG TPA: hypothetical protein VFJ16_18665 [Longimicrobium sp.]|nr:hypothetical protein [Longimicrobium sp.]